MRLFFKLSLLLFLISLLTISLIGTALYLYLKATLPNIQSLKYYHPIQTNLILDTNGKIIGFLGEKKRIFVPLNKIPKHVILAFIAAEDAHFFEHKGIDFLGILRALYKDIIAGKIVQGGSTITQQVVKCLLLTPERTIERKIKEMFLAWQIEKYLTKEEILTIYLNHIYLGRGAYGVEAAALTYFGKHIWELDLNEAAVLAGLPPAPSRYNPIVNMNAAIKRRNYVLKRMAEEGFISWELAEKVMKQPIKLHPMDINIPLYAAYFIDALKREFPKYFPEQKLLYGGFTIKTTLDKDWQKKAYKSALETLRRLFPDRKDLPEFAVICISNKDGAVRVLIGGKDFRKSPFNRAVLGKRQIGSAIKPFIWAQALEKGIIIPSSIIPDDPIIIQGIDKGKDWAPQNYDGKYMGPIDVKNAIAHSRNTVAVRIALLLGIDNLKELLTRLDLKLPKFLNYSLALGSYEMTPLEVVRIYSNFPNLGIMVYPFFVESVWNKIYDRSEIVYQHKLKPKRVFSEYTAGIMNDFLEAVVDIGTGRCAKKLGVPVAGKTGTTQNYNDAWFIGYTADYTCAVWVGYDKEKTLGKEKTGGKVACPIWLSVMKSIPHLNKPIPKHIQLPEDIEEFNVIEELNFNETNFNKTNELEEY